MKKKQRPFILLLLYSCLMQLAFWLLQVGGLFSKNIANHLRLRQLPKPLLASLQRKRKSKKHGVLVFCSSAGEYEQAKPLLDRFRAHHDIDVNLIFFSQSGYEFAKKRKEKTSFFKSPPDTLWHWWSFFRAIQPNIIVVVRHELWPAFLHTASFFGRSFLIDASQSETPKKGAGLWIKKVLLSYFDRVHVVSFKDAQTYNHEFGVDKEDLSVSGDTKYDRVMERFQQSKQESELLKTKWRNLFGEKKRLIIGSAWHEDVKLVLSAYKDLLSEGVLNEWQLVIAPHDISDRMVRWIDKQCSDFDLPSLRSSELGVTLSSHLSLSPIVVVDQMGLLAELYGSCQLAFVGGALHHKVHNVLEPACRGLFFSFGPLYKNSQEACQFVENGLVDPIQTPEELKQWWRKHLDCEVPDQDMLEFVREHCGAAEKISREIFEKYLDVNDSWKKS